MKVIYTITIALSITVSAIIPSVEAKMLQDFKGRDRDSNYQEQEEKKNNKYEECHCHKIDPALYEWRKKQHPMYHKHMGDH